MRRGLNIQGLLIRKPVYVPREKTGQAVLWLSLITGLHAFVSSTLKITRSSSGVPAELQKNYIVAEYLVSPEHVAPPALVT